MCRHTNRWELTFHYMKKNKNGDVGGNYDKRIIMSTMKHKYTYKGKLPPWSK